VQFFCPSVAQSIFSDRNVWDRVWHLPQANPNTGVVMKLTRLIVLGLAVLLPSVWTVAQAEDAPAEAGKKKGKKGKKEDKAEGEKKAE
jgi:hypothetical protein